MSTAVVLGLYLFLLILVGWAVSRVRSVEDFLIAGRGNPGFVMAAGIIIGWVDATWFVFYSTMGYQLGWACAWLVVGNVAGFGLLALWAPKIRELSQKHNMHTLTDWFHHFFGMPSAILCGTIVTIMFISWVAVIFVSAGLFGEMLFGVPRVEGTLAVGLVALPLLLKGGYGSLTRFDVVQFLTVATLLVATFTFYLAPTTPHLTFGPAASFASTGWLGGLSLAIIGFSANFAAADVWQRMYAVRSARHIRQGMGLAILMYIPALASSVVIGTTALAAGFAGNANEVFPYFYTSFLTPTGQLLVALMLLAAVASSINVTIFGAAMSLTKDFSSRNLTPHQLQHRVRLFTLLIIAVSCATALITQNIMGLGLSLLSVCSCLVPALLANLAGLKPHRSAVFASLLAGLAAFLMLLAGNAMTAENSSLPLGVSLATLIPSHLLTLRSKKAARTARRKRR
ncbi:MAG: hypothetical protein GC129_06110 [Proteobacteria bacterium]|nr:hypothetical protein [Pseudomonadota bacterium]